MISLAPATAMGLAFLIVLLDTLKVRGWPVRLAFLTGAVLPGLVLLLSDPVEVVGGWDRRAGIEVAFTPLNAPFLVGEGVLFLFVALYAVSYFREDGRYAKVLSLLLLMHAGLMGAFVARDLFNFYIYSEIASVSAFALVALPGKEARRAAFKYLIVSLLASYLFVFAVGIIYMETGYLNVALIAENAVESRELSVALGIALSALLLKAGIFPLHSWLPDAHSMAPTPVSAMLSGALVKAPAYGMVLLISSLPSGEALRTALLAVAVASLFFGVAMALLQKNAKRLLAYHTVSQMGYVLLGIASLNFLGAAYYAMAHSIFKGGLFLGVGSLAGERKELGTFGYRGDHFLSISIIALSLAIGGVSPLVGAYGKGLLYENLDGLWKLAVPAGSVGTLASFTKLNAHLAAKRAGKIPLRLKVPVFGLALAAIAGGVYLNPHPNPKDTLYLALAVALFLLLRRAGLLGIKGAEKGGEIGEEINRLVAGLVAFVVLLSLIQGL
ncbi:proton-conducting transporter transmembrane domain-containing protein [Thermococcus nautili]|uniref:Formate hydrogenlyase subunit 3/Multisubunit Na+/H+ antiporter, MnhD subunit n=1 Tax=Thermococcus nautili TaxID=195522 RepID=W8NVV3_9EURY|nr:proton-conducting transporter membrane subunit [Thermococcus nautili]AHL23297.1 Formate hydrogenlyase subunit 3/Multisubunit Na+/H+ antiporter, MnhD subunit [Thermococcus nautili]